MKQKLIAKMKWNKAREKAIDRILRKIKEEQPTEDSAEVLPDDQFQTALAQIMSVEHAA